MYKTSFLIWVIFISLTSLSQAQSIAETIYSHAAQVTIPSYQMKPFDCHLKMAYGQFNLENDDVLKEILNDNIKSVALLYSDYPKGMSFQRLNINRFQALIELYPQLTQDQSIKWYLVKQTDCTTKEDANLLVHGFIVKLKQRPEVVKNQILGNLIPERTQQLLDTLPKEDYKYVTYGRDLTSVAALERNFTRWKDIVTVSDWTSSMYPFTGQILRWHIDNWERSGIKNFVFFNDGDQKEDKDKVIGETGGLYAIRADSIDNVIKLMKHIEWIGGGGDIPENDIEALLFTQERFPDAKTLVLIADNTSAVRDMKLLEKVKKPVHIIIGRLKYNRLIYLNPQYLTIAKKTGGSLHTRKYDFNSPEELEKLEKWLIHKKETTLKKRQKTRNTAY
ncbi:hypothetical protein AAG747_13680 [Rapidithrix thailandica]|uniref:VWA domain-containing protein n=1 Tax=Rapidithrix thailandica TaxID=413964 RepID=A0AAW9S962_9BACT